jgi:transposase InsO family protein
MKRACPADLPAKRPALLPQARSESQGVMTDNGSAFKSHKYRGCLKRLGIKHKRTKAYSPDQRQGRTLRQNVPVRMGL